MGYCQSGIALGASVIANLPEACQAVSGCFSPCGSVCPGGATYGKLRICAIGIYADNARIQSPILRQERQLFKLPRLLRQNMLPLRLVR